jgi:hypothetical protein
LLQIKVKGAAPPLNATFTEPLLPPLQLLLFAVGVAVSAVGVIVTVEVEVQPAAFTAVKV